MTIKLSIIDSQLKKEYESGLNIIDLAKIYKCRQETISKRLKFMGCKIKRGERNKLKLPVTNIELKAEYNNGMDTVELAAKYGCHNSTISKRLKSTECKIKKGKRKLPLSNSELKREYESGSRVIILAEICECSIPTILNRLKSVGCKVQDSKIVNLPITNINLKEVYESGISTYQLAKEYGCDRSTIVDRLKSVGCKVQDSRIINLPVTNIKLKEEYEDGISTVELGVKYECSYHIILKRLKSMGCEIRDGKGENASNWQGGISFEPYCPKFNESFKESIRNKFDRKCFICGITEKEMQEDQRRRGKRIFKLSVHHVNYNKDCLCDDSDCEFVPLCLHHHVKTNNNHEYWESMIMQKLNDLNNNDGGLRAHQDPIA